MGYAGARLATSLGGNMRAIGQLIARQREQAEATRLADEERQRRTEREDLHTDLTLAQLGGGRGPMPTVEAPNFQAEPTQIAPPAPISLSGQPARASRLADPSAIGPTPEIEAPAAATHAISRPDPRYTQVGKDAYILTAGARAQQEQEERLGVVRSELEAKREFQVADENRRIASIARTYLRTTKGATEQEAQTYAERVVHGLVDPTPQVEQFPTGLVTDPSGEVVQLGSHGSVHRTGIKGQKTGTNGTTARSSVTADARKHAQERARAVAYIGGLVQSGAATGGGRTHNQQYLSDLVRQHFPQMAADAIGITTDAIKKYGTKTTKVGSWDYKVDGDPQVAPAAPDATVAAAPDTLAAAPEAITKEMAIDSLATWKARGIPLAERERMAREKGWL